MQRILIWVLVGVLLAACGSAAGGLLASPTPTLCPMATPEALRVAPVTSPTDELSQIIEVQLNNGDEITIETESGVFTQTIETPSMEWHPIEITLLPNTVHHLTVTGHVQKGERSGGCMYGGYILTTQTDTNYEPLVISQGNP